MRCPPPPLHFPVISADGRTTWVDGYVWGHSWIHTYATHTRACAIYAYRNKRMQDSTHVMSLPARRGWFLGRFSPFLPTDSSDRRHIPLSLPKSGIYVYTYIHPVDRIIRIRVWEYQVHFPVDVTFLFHYMHEEGYTYTNTYKYIHIHLCIRVFIYK